MLEQIGGALLEEIAPAPLAADALAKTLARLDGTPFDAPRPRRPSQRQYAGAAAPVSWAATCRDVRWRRMGPHLAYVPLFRRGSTRVRLLRGAPGADTGRHSHRGMEYTLVLAGGFTDETGSYGPGDLQVADAGDLAIIRLPIRGEDCINLAVTTGPLQFDGFVQKIAGPSLFGF